MVWCWGDCSVGKVLCHTIMKSCVQVSTTMYRLGTGKSIDRASTGKWTHVGSGVH